MLPDNFGDIYAGETFSAYIALVNGMPDISFSNVNISVRVQGTQLATDLKDVRVDNSNNSYKTKIIAPLESIDMVVNHQLNEVGMHTMRVLVTYNDSALNQEFKTLKKFYRFNVLNPLKYVNKTYFINDHYYIQTTISNITKAVMTIENVMKYYILFITYI